MKNSSKRFIAFMAALMLFLSAGGALAEAPVSLGLPNADTVVAAGGTVGFEASARFDETTLKGLLGMFMAGAVGNEAGTTMVDAILGALNKMHVRGAYAKDAFAGALGTEEGELISLQAAYDETTMENTLITNLMPNLAISLDPEMVKSVLGQMPRMSQAQALSMLAPYGAAMMGFIQEQIGPKPEIALEPYDIAGVGLFHFKADFDITSREAAGLIETLYNIFKNDQNIQSLIKQAATAGGEDATEALGEMESGIAQMKAAEDMVFLTGSVYMNETGDTSYVVVDTPKDGEGRAHITVLVEGAAVHVKVLVKNKEIPAMTAEETPPPAADIDWAKLEADILSGANYMDVLVAVETDVQVQANALGSTAKVNVIAGGMNIRVEAEGTNRIDKLETQSEMRFYMNGQNPLVTFSARMYELEEHPQLPQLEGRTMVTVMVNEEGEMIPSDLIAMQRGMEQMPMILMAGLNKALPVEGPALVALITDYLTPQEPEITTPEPVVVEEPAPAESAPVETEPTETPEAEPVTP